MRIAGWILLIAGALLCATLVWATIGFLLMGVGLLSLLAAESKRNRAGRLIARDAGLDQPALPPATALPSIAEPDLLREPSMETNWPAYSYDRQEWQRLLGSDEDLAAVASVLADYGHQYVDELAREYLAAGADKTRLPEIVDGIIGRAGAGVAPRPKPAIVEPAGEVQPVNRVRRNNLMAARPDRQPRSLPEFSEPLPDSAPQRVEPVKPQTISTPASLPIAMEPPPIMDDPNKTIMSDDEELTAMLRKLAPDAATPSKN